ncbi:MAG TPA: AAA family ATPase, partial [Acidimicrobiales bacterium]|nr:AAA family ATPase [Acidimicrobiales bacterium]
MPAVRTTRLVGRDAELRRITEMLDRARAGRSGSLAVVGEPGMGKTALLDEAARAAAGFEVIWARGVQSEAQVPFAGLSELLRPTLGSLADIPSAQATALEAALALIPGRPEDRFAVGAATLSLLAARAEAAPLFVVVDDVQWIDGSSADALAFALRRLLADRAAALLAARLGEASLLDRTDLPRIVLAGLDAASACAVLARSGAAVPPDAAERLWRHTGGNPLGLLEAARHVDRWPPGLPLDTPLPVVTGVSEGYLSTVRRLPDDCRLLLLLAAADDVGDLAVLARAGERLGVELAGIGPAEGARLVEVAGDRLEFSHPLVRSAVYGEATPADRRRAHRALADALPDAEADRRAWHLALAALGPDEAAASALEQAGARARRRSAYDVASRALERSARLTAGGPERGRRLLGAAEAAWGAGSARRAGALLAEASREPLPPADVVAVEHLRGHIATRIGPVREGLDVLVAAAARAWDSDPARAAVILAEAVNAGFYAGDPAAMQAAAARIAALPEPGDAEARFFATLARGMAATFAGDAAAGAALLRRSIAAGAAAPAPGDDPRRLAWAAMAPLWLRDNGPARTLIERATEVARARAAIGALPYL